MVSVQVTLKAIEQTSEYSLNGQMARLQRGVGFTPRADNTTFVSVTNTGFERRWG